MGIAVSSNITTVASFDRISKLDQNYDYDDYVAAPVDEINSFYHTGWFVGNRPTFPKRWGKTRTVVLSDNNCVIVMYVYKDYDPSTSVAGYSKTLEGLDSPALWDAATSDYVVLDNVHRNEIRKGLRMARQLIAPELLLIPLPAAGEAS